jgi:hypothetical protein
MSVNTAAFLKRLLIVLLYQKAATHATAFG